MSIEKTEIGARNSQLIEIVSTDGEIILRQYIPEDAEEAFALIARNKAHLTQPGDDTGKKYKDVDKFRESITHPKNPRRLRFGIRTRDGVLVGSINLTPDETNSQQAEIGYYLDEQAQGRGYAGRAIEALTQYAFTQLNYLTLFGEVVPGNARSVQAIERAGYTQTGKHEGMVVLSKSKV